MTRHFLLQDQNHRYRHFEVGRKTELYLCKPTKVIMMVGMTGAGKSLMLNNMVNFVYGVSFKDDFRFKLILEEDELSERRTTGDATTSSAHSMTRWVSSYTLHYQEGFRVPYSLVLIDTPGFGDTRGVNFDESIGTSIKEFYGNKIQPINEMSSIGLVIQSSQSRLTAEQMYVFDSVLNIFGKDVTENICLLFTFADAQPPPALKTVEEEKIPFPKNGVFKFNNSAVFASTNTESNAYYWKFGYDSLEKYFLHLQLVQPVSLTLTKQVLQERETLQQILQALQEWISKGFGKLETIENITRVIMQLKGTMKANKDYTIETSVDQQETKTVDHSITNCVICNYTCHDPCTVVGDNKERCHMMKKGKCIKCPGKCPSDAHQNGCK